MSKPEETAMTVRSLWAQLLPLSLSEVTMAAGEPLITTTLAHLPEAQVNLAAAGVVSDWFGLRAIEATVEGERDV